MDKLFKMKVVNESSSDVLNYLTINDISKLIEYSSLTGIPQAYFVSRAIKEKLKRI